MSPPPICGARSPTEAMIAAGANVICEFTVDLYEGFIGPTDLAERVYLAIIESMPDTLCLSSSNPRLDR